MNSRLLKAKCMEKGLSVVELANKINRHPSTLYKKIADGSFTVKEVNSIIESLSLNQDEVFSIFFGSKVA